MESLDQGIWAPARILLLTHSPLWDSVCLSVKWQVGLDNPPSQSVIVLFLV